MKFNDLSLRNLSTTQRKDWLEKKLNLKLSNISANYLEEAQLVGKNIENLLGTTQIPLGIAGPIKLIDISNKKQFKKEVFVPLATTEGALVASVARGCKAINMSGGVRVNSELVGITRGPIFETASLQEGLALKNWIEQNFGKIAKSCSQTSSHLKLLKIDQQINGRYLYARFYFDTQDAMGMNMATFATEEAAHFILKNTKVKLLALAGNFDIDKKPAWLNFINGRGRKVWAEVKIKQPVIKEVLKTTAPSINQMVIQKCLVGSALAGSLGYNAHFANIIAALFVATGQDLAQVVEGSMGVTSSEILANGDLLFSIYLPSLIVGTVGGGTTLPTQQEALKIMGVSEAGKVDDFAKIIAASVLAGELSLISSLAEGSLSKAHRKLARKGKSS